MSNEQQTGTRPIAQRQEEFLSEVVRKSRAVRIALERVMPEATEEILSTLSRDLAAFWQVAEQHHRRVDELLALGGPEDGGALAQLLTDLLYRDLIARLDVHAESMERLFPEVIEYLIARQKAAEPIVKTKV